MGTPIGFFPETLSKWATMDPTTEGPRGSKGSREGFFGFLVVSEEAHKSIPDGKVASKVMVL